VASFGFLPSSVSDRLREQTILVAGARAPKIALAHRQAWAPAPSLDGALPGAGGPLPPLAASRAAFT
jgi:hypothetical protein